jgi:hypothetical protein
VSQRAVIGLQRPISLRNVQGWTLANFCGVFRWSHMDDAVQRFGANLDVVE